MQPPLSRPALVELLANARQHHSLSIRRAAALAKVPSSTAQGWFEGRHLPTPALMPHFLTLLESLELVDSDEERETWKSAVARLRNVVSSEASPYVGLRSYTAQESLLFMGRERAYCSLVEACTPPDRTDGATTVVVVGDSGSGKSSLLAAGLVGRACAPGGPLHHLEPVALDVADLPGFVVPEAPTLLVIDQFEDAERLDPAVQGAVFDTLAGLPASVTCVVGLTASAFGFALRDERLAAHLASPVLVGSLTPEEYTRIIEDPAHLHGRRVSPALTQLLLRDMRQYGEPAPGTVLPLLSNALRRCWFKASGDVLSTADYLATGGFWSALDAEAESVLAGFTPEQQKLVPRLMLSLVQVDGATILRSRIPEASLQAEMTLIADGFLAARLLTRKDGQLAISHDALLTRWKRLSQWVDQEKASLLIGRRIHMAAHLWEDGGRSPDALMPVEAVLWKEWSQSANATLLSDWEHAFIEESLTLADTTQRDQQRTITRIRRRQHVAVAAALVAVAMMATTVVATARSEGFRSAAEAATLSAQARQVALIADEMRPIAPNVAGQLSVAALSLDTSVQSRSAVVKSAGEQAPTRATGPAGNTMVAYSPENSITVRGDYDGNITLWRDGSLASPPITVASGGGQLFALRTATVAGRTLAIVGGQQTAGIWDLTGEPRKLGDFGEDTVIYSAAWSGNTAIFGTLEGQVRRVDCSDPDALTELATLLMDEEVAVTGLTSADNLIIAGGRRDRMEVFNTTDHSHGHVAMDGTALSIDSSPDGREILVGSAAANATLWRDGVAGWATVHTIDTSSSVTAVRHVGDRFLIAGAFGEVREFNAAHELTATYRGRTVVTSIDASPAGVFVGSTEGSAVFWPADASTAVFTAPDDVVLYGLLRTPDVLMVGTSAGAELFSEGEDGWLPVTKTPPPVDTNYTPYYGMSGDGSVLVNQTTDGSLVTLEPTPEGYAAVDSMLLPHRSMNDVMVSQTGRYMAIGYRGKTGYHLMRRDGAGWENFATVDAWPGGCNFSRDETTFAAMDVDGTKFVVWSLTDEAATHVTTVALEGGATPSYFDFSPTGALAVGDSEGTVTVFGMDDPAQPQVSQVLPEARSSLSQLRYSDDGNRLLASTHEGQLWVWEQEGDGFVLDLQLSPGTTSIQGADSFGKSLVMSLDDGRTVAWPSDASAAAEQLCRQFGTPLSEAEWTKIVPGVGFVNGC